MKMKEKIKRFLTDSFLYNVLLLQDKYHKTYNEKRIKKSISKTYKRIFHKKLNWDNPTTFNEKIHVSKYLNSSEYKTNLTDKYLVRDWVSSKIGSKYLIPLIGVYNKFEDIDFDKLPDKFVMKCTHDSGSVFICHDKKQLNYRKLKNHFNYYMKRNYAYAGFEMHYKNIEPKIIIEKYMGYAITDYKFFCFDGKPYYCRIDIDRFGNHRRNIYDMNWNLQPFFEGKYLNKPDFPKPDNFDEMISIAKKLCSGIDQVRVDLYSIDGKTYFGEMTFTNNNGKERFHPDLYDTKIGKLWKFK